MANAAKTVIVTGGSRGIGASLVKAFLDRGYDVVANSRNISRSGAFEASDKLALVDGDIAEAAAAARVVDAARSKFGSIDALVNNAGIYFAKPFTDYTIGDLSFPSTLKAFSSSVSSRLRRCWRRMPAAAS
jgi:NAD(P)-dependent dehydrogenase (short-subunit alcohol dehydrogenase family)